MGAVLIGLGCGTASGMTAEAREALESADLVIGAARLLDAIPEIPGQERVPAVRTEEIAALLRAGGAERPCVVYSGDSGFYSGARPLIPELREAGIGVRVLPGISSVQILAARLGRPWQGWGLYSAHGRACDPVTAVCGGRPAFFLTGSGEGPAELCRELTAAGLGDLPVTVGEALGHPRERIWQGTATSCTEERFDALCVMLAEAAPVPERRTPGLPDEAFVRGKVPMTKRDIRAAALSRLAVRPEDTVWDIGAGTGSVSVELALAARRGRVYAIEQKEEAVELIRRNRERHRTWGLSVIEGWAPDVLADLPAPDAAFIGGTGGRMAEIVDAVLVRSPEARICVSAIALETLAAATAALTAHGREPLVSQIASSRTRPAGTLHLLRAEDPVFLISSDPGGAS